MAKVRVENVTKSSLHLLRSLNEKIFPILTGPHINDEFYEDFVDEDTGFALFVYRSDLLAGGACCIIEENNSLYLKFIGVHSRHRRKGLGTALLRKVVARGRELDVHRIYMYVRADNKSAIRCGQKLGFVPAGDKGPDLIILERKMHER